MGSKAPLFSHIANIYICCKYIIEGRGKPTALHEMHNLFLSDMKDNMCYLSTFVRLIPSVSVNERYYGGTYTGGVLLIRDLLFSSFILSNFSRVQMGSWSKAK